MSILIKGMEMPHDCDECRLCAFIPVGDYAINRKCLPLNAKAEITIRRANCPLVPVPKHGLIDKAMLLRNIADNQFANASADKADTYEFWRKVLGFVEGFPTVIEAEPQKEET